MIILGLLLLVLTVIGLTIFVNFITNLVFIIVGILMSLTLVEIVLLVIFII